MSETVSPAIDAARLDAVIRPFLERAAPVGMTIGVVRDGRLAYTHHTGTADLPTLRPVDATTPFRVGSISKTFTAIAVMQLRNQGLIDLDDPVERHLTSVRWVTRAGHRPATIREVLTHTGGVGELRGWRDALLLSTYGGLGVKAGTPIPSPSQYYRRGLRPEVAPGTKWAYANHAFTALGQLVEDVSGKPFADYMRTRVFDVLGMAHTDFVRTPRIGEPATGYRVVRGAPRPVPWQDVAVAPAGSVVSSLTDMAAFVGWLMSNDDDAVLAPASLREMFQQHWTPDPRLPGQGLGFLRDDLGGHGIVWHDGAWPGFISSMLVAPEAKLGVLAFNNSSSSVSHEVAEAVLRELLGVPAATGAPAPAGAGVAAQVSGTYRPLPGLQTNLRYWAMLGGGLRIGERDGQLTATGRFGRLRKPVVLHAADPADPFLLEAVVPVKRTGSLPMRLAFQRDGHGEVTGVAGSLLIPFHFRRDG